ncbi:tetratricopeptide repeat protein [Rivihabitans pingtungensis]|uniref:tetratricopeptide repeat protein n=1 Tax=Rivihabitans pingtungensis TaxID=1054498 RepID=UPI0023527BD2|nr:tetratricopeptide repeat protein [Rivihabitans pingtungensis]MCK6438429.1 tetratricopeptide repeat protein [Rivihabitans pingtungensis]
MNIRLTATAALLASVLSACAITSAPAPVAQAPAPAPEAAYPKLALSNDILFGVLASEIAAQRGAAAASAPTVLALAQRTRDPRLARRAAEFALTANRLDEAIRALKLWQELEPASDNAQYQLIAALLRAGRLSEATPGVQAQLAARPHEAAQVFMHLAGLLSRQPDKAGAYAMMKTLLAPYPSVAEGHFALMITAQEAGDDAMAQAEMATLATLAPAWDYPVGWQVERLRQTSPEAALALLERELARRPQAGLELRLSYPRLLVMVKRYDAARDAFVQLSNKYPHQPEVAYAIGVLSYELKDYEEAERSLRDALALGYREPDFVRFTLGQMAEERKLPQEAVNWYEAITSGPQLPQAQSRLAVLEAEDGKLDAALARLERLADMQNTPRPARVLAQAQLARNAEQPDRALAILSAALAKDGNVAEWRYERALLLDDRERVADAERDLRAYLKLKPKSAQGLNALGYILANRTSRIREARELVSRALKLDPDNPMILDSMGWVEYRSGKLEAALRYLQRAHHLMPDPEIAAHLGEVLWKMGREAEARELWARSLEANPDSDIIRRTQQRFIP